MSVTENLDALANSIAGAKPNDTKGLLGIHGMLGKLLKDPSEDLPEIFVAALEQAVTSITALVWHESDDGDNLLEIVVQTIGYAQELMRAIDAGESPNSVKRPEQARADNTSASTSSEHNAEIDVELLTLFVNSCQETLEKLEQSVLELEGLDDQSETIESVMRGMHTLKGECGVLSLEEAQRLFHLAEDLIGECIRTKIGISAEPVLALIDWMGVYVGLLANDSTAAPPFAMEVLEGLVDCFPESEGTVDDSTSDKTSESTPKSQSASRPKGRNAVPGSSPAQPDSAEADSGELVSFPAHVFEDPLLGEVLEEMRQHLEDAEGAMLEWVDDLGNDELVDVIFRAFHTLKGVGGLMQLEAIVRVAHKSETMLDEFRNGSQECTQEHLALLFRSRDIMGSLLDTLGGGAAPPLSRLTKLITDLGHILEKGTPVLVNSGPSLVPAAPAVEKLEATPEVSEAPKTAEKPVATRNAGNGIAPIGSPAKKEKPKRSKKKLRVEKTVKVGTSRLDSLVDMVGELVIAQQMVSQDPELVSTNDERLTRNLVQVGKITRDLQEAAMHLRMVPLHPTFQKMKRLVHDVARKSGKGVNLNIYGEDTEIDRNVVEEIGDPLVHLVRNAVDHGLEPEEERLAAGKSKNGSLELKAYHQGGSIVIEMSDDGRGLDRAKIFAKSVERGLIPAGVTEDDISDSDLWLKLFQPGFSTAAKVTDISGRGVGLDVVRRKIESLRGKIEIESKLGKGTTFILRLPLTLAIIDGMIIRIGDRRYVIPTLTIEQSFRPDSNHLKSVLGEGLVVDVRGMLIPVHRLKDMLALNVGVDEVTEGILLLVETAFGRVCLLADEIIGQHQVVIKSIGKALPGVVGISGGAILGDGNVALIIDADGLVAQELGSSVLGASFN